jgi:hypothetical protein
VCLARRCQSKTDNRDSQQWSIRGCVSSSALAPVLPHLASARQKINTAASALNHKPHDSFAGTQVVNEDDDDVSLSRCHVRRGTDALLLRYDCRRLNLAHVPLVLGDRSPHVAMVLDQYLVPADLRDIGRDTITASDGRWHPPGRDGAATAAATGGAMPVSGRSVRNWICSPPAATWRRRRRTSRWTSRRGWTTML